MMNPMDRMPRRIPGRDSVPRLAAAPQPPQIKAPTPEPEEERTTIFAALDQHALALSGLNRRIERTSGLDASLTSTRQHMMTHLVDPLLDRLTELGYVETDGHQDSSNSDLATAAPRAA